MSNKETNLKEKFRQALASTIRVISEDLKTNQKEEKNKSSNKFDFFELDNLNSKMILLKQELKLIVKHLKKILK